MNSRFLWLWQVGWGTNDASMNPHTTLIDVACNATNKITCLQEDIYGVTTTNELAYKVAGARAPIQWIGSGQDVYVRANCVNSASDSTPTAVAYALS